MKYISTPRTAKAVPIKVNLMRQTSSLSTTQEEEGEESSRQEEDAITLNSVSVRTKSLLKGNIQIQKRSFRKITSLVATAGDDPDSSSAEEEDLETIVATPSEEALPWMIL